MVVTSVVTSEFRSRSPSFLRTLVHYLSHLDSSITCTVHGEIARDVGVRRRRVSWEHLAVFTAAHVISYLHEMPLRRFYHIYGQPTLYSSMMFLVIRGCTGCGRITWRFSKWNNTQNRQIFLPLPVCGCTWICVVAPGYTWLLLVICGCTWLCVVSPSVTFLNHCIPLATVCTTRCSYMFQHKREMCTEAARVVWYVVPVGIFVITFWLVTY
jgi:hypothetical protein